MMRRWNGRPLLCAAILLVAVTAPATAQLPNPSAAALGMGENHTANPRGFEAVSWNPAGLALPGGPRASGSIAAIRAVAGLGPVGLGDFTDFEGASLPDQVRQRWLDRITDAGAERGSAGGDITYLAAQVGRLGAHVATTAHLVGTIGPGAAELLLFGNAGRSGEPADVPLDGSAFDAAVTSTVGLSYAHPVIRDGRRSLSLGGTLKYTVGHLMATAVDLGGAATADPLAIDFELPVAQTNSNSDAGARERGSGIGVDLGLAWREGPLSAGLVVRNVFNTFAWNEDELIFRAGRVSVSGESRATDFEEQPFSAAPAPIRARVRKLGYPTVVAGGIAYEVRPDLHLQADLRQRVGDGELSDPATHAGLGAEYRPAGWLPLRAGAALISEGYLFSGGLGIDLSPVRLDAAVARRRTDLGIASMAMFTFSFVAQ